MVLQAREVPNMAVAFCSFEELNMLEDDHEDREKLQYLSGDRRDAARAIAKAQRKYATINKKYNIILSRVLLRSRSTRNLKKIIYYRQRKALKQGPSTNMGVLAAEAFAQHKNRN